jgi:hypothetical protein
MSGSSAEAEGTVATRAAVSSKPVLRLTRRMTFDARANEAWSDMA